MPDLPTITVTAAQATRIQNTIGDATAYRKWLKEKIIQEVLHAETTASRTALLVEYGIAEPGTPV